MPELTDLSYIRDLCTRYGFSFTKGLGQNFLVNPGICPKICDVAEIDKTTDVLEIGPGFGTLTRELARRARRVLALEVDGRLLPVLQETLAEFDNVQLLHQDALKTDFASLLHRQFGGPVNVCGNLPYNITSPLLMRLLESDAPMVRITAMVQKEAAQRIVAQPGSRESGAISYAVHYRASPRLAFTVKPGSFYPPPKVNSAVIRLDMLPQRALAEQHEREERLFLLVRAAFSQRRKTFVNSVSASLPLQKQQIADALAALGLDVRIRPERLTLQNYIALEGQLWP